MFKANCKRVLNSILLVFGGSILGVVVLALAFLVPVNTENKEESIKILDEEGWYPATPMHKASYDTYFHSFLPGVLDNSTDRIMITTANDEMEENPFVRAMNMHSDYVGNYSYYWHGYVSIIRPLLFLFDYAEIRILNVMLQVLIIFLLAYEVCCKKSKRYAILMLTSYGLLMPLALASSLQFTWVFYISTLSCLYMLKNMKFLEEKSGYLYFFIVIGMLTSFFDLLTYPLFTWGFPLIWWFLTCRKDLKSKEYLCRCIYSGLNWIVGYGGMWSLKWIWGTLITRNNIIETAIAEVFLRVGMESGGEYTLYNRVEAIYNNWKHYEYIIYAIILFAWFIWVVIRSFQKGWKYSYKSPALLLTAFSSFVWYWILANHTKTHHFFTYRIFVICILAIFAIFLESINIDTEERTLRTINSKKTMFATWVVAGICAIGLTLFARESIIALNGHVENVHIPLEEGSNISVDFVPTFSDITNIGLAMASESTEGDYIISIYQDGKILYEQCIPIVEYGDMTYADVAVDWSLDTDEQYNMVIRAQGNNSEVNAIVTIPSLTPMNEFSNMSVNGVETGGQPIMGISYLALPTSRKTLLFLAISWTAFCAAVLNVIITHKEEILSFLDRRKISK